MLYSQLFLHYNSKYHSLIKEWIHKFPERVSRKLFSTRCHTSHGKHRKNMLTWPLFRSDRLLWLHCFCFLGGWRQRQQCYLLLLYKCKEIWLFRLNAWKRSASSHCAFSKQNSIHHANRNCSVFSTKNSIVLHYSKLFCFPRFHWLESTCTHLHKHYWVPF
jgi:hypothetical protein